MAVGSGIREEVVKTAKKVPAAAATAAKGIGAVVYEAATVTMDWQTTVATAGHAMTAETEAVTGQQQENGGRGSVGGGGSGGSGGRGGDGSKMGGADRSTAAMVGSDASKLLGERVSTRTIIGEHRQYFSVFLLSVYKNKLFVSQIDTLVFVKTGPANKNTNKKVLLFLFISLLVRRI